MTTAAFSFFHDRAEAGTRLAERLTPYRDDEPVILALPRGGVPVALEVARALGAPLDLVFVRKIGAPFQPELAVAAIAVLYRDDEPVRVRNDDLIRLLKISEKDISAAEAEQLAEIARRRKQYIGDRGQIDLDGETVIIVDDGIATGATAVAAVRAVRSAGASRVVVAAPVAAPEAVERLKAESAEVVCLHVPMQLGAIGAYYDDFHQLSDAEVIDRLDEAENLEAEAAEKEDRPGD